MKNKKIVLLAVFCAFSLPFMTAIASADSPSQAKVIDILGEAKFLKAGTSNWEMLDKGMMLSEGDSLRTVKGSQVKLELSGNAKTAEVTVREESEFSLKTLKHDPASKVDNTLLDVSVGSILVKAEKLIGDSKFEVKTPTSIVGIRGTVFEVQVSKA